MKKLLLFFLFASLFVSSTYSQTKNIKVLICKPNNFNYTVDKKTVWIPTIVEGLLYFRLNAVNGLSVVTLSELGNQLKDSRDFTKRISKSKYTAAAKELGATHFLYSEYEAVSPKEATIYFKLIPINDPSAETKKEVGITIDNVDKPITEVVSQLIDAMGIAIDNQPSDFFAMDVIAGGVKGTSKLGTTMQDQSADKSISVASSCEGIANKFPGMYLATYIAANLYALGGDIDGASRCVRLLAGTFGAKYPKLQLQLAQIYFDNKKYMEAERTLSRLSSNPDIKNEVLWLTGLAKEGLGKYSEAVTSFSELKEIDSENGLLFLHLANISFAQNKSDEGASYINEAARILGKGKAQLLLDVGTTLLSSKKDAQAVTVLEKSFALDPTNTSICLKLGDAYLSIRKDSLAALSYLKLYDLDYLKFQEYLKKGGELFIRSGKITDAKIAYTAAFEKTSNPDIAIMIAELEAMDNNCAAIDKLLSPLAAPYSNQDNVKAMLEKCAVAKNGPAVILNGKPIDTIFVGASYSDLGATANDNEDGDLTSSIVKKGVVNAMVPGSYEIFYNATDETGNIGTVKRLVVVMDNKEPKVTLVGGTPYQQMVGKVFVDPGVKAIDNVDGDISSKAVVSGSVDVQTIGTYNIGYEVVDAAGNSATIIRVVNVYDPSKPIDKTPPRIKLVGGSKNIINVGDTYEEPGVNAIDETDGDVTAFINIEGEVDASTPGKYTITYTAADKSGNKAVKELHVTVIGQKQIVASTTNKSGSKPVSEQLREPLRKSSKPVIAGQHPSKSKRKPILGAISAAGMIGSGITAIIFNSKISTSFEELTQIAYKDPTTGKLTANPGHNQSEVEDKKAEIESSQTYRNIMWGIAGAFALTFTVNLAVPSK